MPKLFMYSPDFEFTNKALTILKIIGYIIVHQIQNVSIDAFNRYVINDSSYTFELDSPNNFANTGMLQSIQSIWAKEKLISRQKMRNLVMFQHYSYSI